MCSEHLQSLPCLSIIKRVVLVIIYFIVDALYHVILKLMLQIYQNITQQKQITFGLFFNLAAMNRGLTT